MALSRRNLAIYAAKRLSSGESPARIARELVASLVQAKKIHEAELLLDDINYELERRRLLSVGRVTTATPLNAALRNEVTKQLKVLSGAKQVTVQEVVDKSVIGGIRLDTALRSWDKTIARKLADIKGGIK